MVDDELEAMKPVAASAEMERWNIEDLESYIARMRAEIARVEAIIQSKGSVNKAAEALFGNSK